MPKGTDIAQMDEPEIEYEHVKLNQQRARWKALKAKYAAELTAHNVTFAANLGPLLDKQATQWKTIQTAIKSTRDWSRLRKKLGAKEPLSPADKQFFKLKAKPTLKAHLRNEASLLEVAEAYKEAVDGLADPARKDLKSFLQGVVGVANNHVVGATKILRRIDSA